MEESGQPRNQKSDAQPSALQMGKYALLAACLAVLATPLLYIRWMKRSPLSWLSVESFEGFGWFVLITGVVVWLVLAGSHGDSDNET